MTNPATILPHWVQTSADFSTWTTQTGLICLQASEGCGQVVGEATLEQALGQVAQPGGAFATVAPAELLGQFVRVVLMDGVGPIVIGSSTGSALWHGLVQASSIIDAGGGVGRQTLHCVGLLSILDQLTVARGAEHRTSESGSGPSSVYDPGYMPPFNRDLGQDASPDELIVGIDGSYFYATTHQRSTAERYNWTAAKALKLVLAICAHGEFSPAYARLGALRWTFADSSGCLSFKLADLDIFGGSVLAAVNTLINARRGLTYRVTVSGTTAIINVTSTAPTALTGGTYTLPAAVATHAPDLTGGAATGLAGVDLSEDAGATYDIIELIGAQPWLGLTVAYEATPDSTTALGKGWKSWQETLWDAGDASASSETVWRRFALRAAWNGAQYDDATYGLRANLTFNADGSTDGSRTHVRGDYSWQPETLQCTRTLPCGDGFSVYLDGGQQSPLIFIGADGAASDWNGVRANEELNSYGKALGVTVEELPGAVLLGHQADDGSLIADAIDDGEPVLVTLGIRESQPLRVRWVRASGSWPRATPRILSVRLPQYEQWLVLPGTVIGVDDDGDYVKVGVDGLSVRDDLPALRHALALMRVWYAEPARTLRYLKRGTIDLSSTTAPGVLVTTATLGVGARTINAPYVRRTWDLTPDNYGTAWDTGRLVPDIEAVR